MSDDALVWVLGPSRLQALVFAVGVAGVVSWWWGLGVVNGHVQASGIGRTLEVLVATGYLSLGAAWLAAAGVAVLALGRIASVRG